MTGVVEFLRAQQRRNDRRISLIFLLYLDRSKQGEAAERMIRVQIVERDGVDLYRTLVDAMREGQLRTLHVKNRGRKVTHERYPGWIAWSHSPGVIDCKVFGSRQPGSEWQLFSAFLGRLADRYAADIARIDVQFPQAKSGARRRKRKRSR